MPYSTDRLFSLARPKVVEPGGHNVPFKVPTKVERHSSNWIGKVFQQLMFRDRSKRIPKYMELAFHYWFYMLEEMLQAVFEHCLLLK